MPLRSIPLLALALSLFTCAASAFADGAPGDKKDGTADDVLSDASLRALSGSTSRWSIASTWNYNGGTIASPFAQDRPNIASQSGTTNKTDIDANISAKYNLNATNALMVGFGIRWIAPFTAGGPSNYDGTRFDALNPFLQYQYIYKWVGIQSVLQVQFMKWTQADFTALGYNYQLSVDQENIYEIGKTGLSLGASLYGQYQWFNKTGAYGDPSNPNTYVADITTQQSRWEVSVSPEIQYQITEKLNIKNLLTLINWEHYVSYQGAWYSTNDVVYDSIGVGISVTRDIFLFPNIQWLPGNIAINQTNVSLQANINVF